MLRRLLAACLTLTLCTAAFAAPPTKDLGKSIADDAALAFKEQRFQEAAELFEKAFALSNDKYVRLRNAGRAWEEAGKLEYARTQFQKYLDKVPTGPDHDEVVERLARLEARIAQKPQVPKAEPAVAVQPAVDVFAPEPAAVPAEPVAHVQQPAGSTNRWLGWTVVGAGVALVAGGTTWFLMTQSANARMQDDVAANRYTPDKLSHDEQTIMNNRILASSLLGVGAVGIIVGAVVAVRSGTQPTSGLSAGVSPNGGTVSWTTRF